MSDENQSRSSPPGVIPEELRTKVFVSRLVLFWELLWPATWPLIAVVMTFALSALSGIWEGAPGWLKVIGLVLFFGAFLAALGRLMRLPVPTPEDGLRYLERRSGIAHRPASSYIDTFAGNGQPPAVGTLWATHRARLKDRLQGLRPGWPRSRFAEADAYAVRVPLTLLLGLAVIFAGPTWRQRLLSPFVLTASIPLTQVRIDAWISPPSYTGRAPIFLTGASAAKPDAANNSFVVPVGSEFVLRAQGSRPITIGMRPLNGAANDPASPGADFAVTAPRDNVREYRALMTAERHITVLDGSNVVARWRVEVIDDTPPQIGFANPPDQSISGALKLSYDLKDDYGITVAEARISRAPDPNRTQPDEPGMEPLVPAPQFTLSLPQLRARSGRGQTYQDLTAHPWAGSRVLITLRAEDDAGQIGTSDPLEIILPGRTFTKPLARAIVEQRRNLALHPELYGHVGHALDALTIAPEDLIDDLTVYLAIRSVSWRLRFNRSRSSFLSAIDQLWQIALHIEDGDLSDAAQELRAAQEALQRALAQNAPPEEVRELMQALRDALDRYMQALAENAPDTARNSEAGSDRDQQTISRQELDRMLDNIENMANNGAQEQAQQLLSQLQDILENLRAGQAQGRSPEQQQMSESLEQLGELMNRQRELMDETFREDRQSQDGEQSRAQDGGEAALNRLQREQADLQAMLEELMDRMQDFNLPPSSSFDDAKGNMGEAIDSLGHGETGPAASQQGEALENLRSGARSLAEQLARSQAGSGRRQGQRDVDPLGRQRATQGEDLGLNVTVPDEIDVQRAREILQELRRKLGEPQRPRLELDYFERLLRQF